MPSLRFQGKQLLAADGESVLDTMLRNGVKVPYACRSGVCGACTMVCSAGELPAISQEGLREVERAQGLFLSCQCRPKTDLEVALVSDDTLTPATVVEHAWLSESIVRVRVQPDQPLQFAAGQYLSIQRPHDGLTRSYSIASLPSDGWIELHVRRVPNGRMSNWMCDEVGPGAKLTLMRPRGSACYPSGELDTPMLMVGVGCGLAPIWGVLRDALDRGHRGPITLLHAGSRPASLYLREQLRELAIAHANLQVRTIVSQGADVEPDTLEQGSVITAAGRVIESSKTPAAWLCFVGGDQEIVKALRLEIFLAGAASARILADPFVITPPSSPCVAECAAP